MTNTDKLKAEYDAREIIGRYTTLTPVGKKDTYRVGPCPWCGGVDRLVVRSDGWLCRTGPGHCGRKGDVIAFVMLREHLDFAGAVAHLVGHHEPAGPKPASPTPATPKHQAHPFDVARWSRNLAYTMSQLTPASPQGRYLAKRRLSPHTWQKFKLGAGYVPINGTKFDAISIPWYDSSGKLIGVNHRLLNPPDPKRRYYVVGDYLGNLWGMATHSGHHETIFITEGELNAASIWQALGVDVLSVGSQNQTINQWWATYISQWENIVLWADNPEVAATWQRAIGRGEIVRSETDANELLKRGELC